MLDDETLVVSEINDDSTGVATGGVFAFDINTGDLLAEIFPPSPGEPGVLGRFGEAVTNAGGALIIGSPRDNTNDGTVYIYEGLIPEPGSAALLAVGGLAVLRRR